MRRIAGSVMRLILAALFAANDKLYSQWTDIIKDTNALVDKSTHCILPEDALKLLQAGQEQRLDVPAKWRQAEC